MTITALTVCFGVFMIALTTVQWFLERSYKRYRDEWLEQWRESNEEFLARLARIVVEKDTVNKP